MQFTRVDDEVAVGVGYTQVYPRGAVVDTDDPGLIALFEADGGWRRDGPEGVPASDGDGGLPLAQSDPADQET